MTSDRMTNLTTPDDHPMMRIVEIDVHGALQDFVAELERGRPVLRRCGVEAQVRAWQATYAGRDTGRIIVTLEFADFAAFARSKHAYARAVADPEFVEWASRLGALRSFTSDSLYVELTPVANDVA